jgi:Protein of unknown function DUF115.
MIENAESKIRSESNLYNSGTKSAQLIHEILNSTINHDILINKIKSGLAKDISDEVKVIGNKSCFILGSGPSLDDSVQYLKQWEGGIICTPSHALTLRYYGIEPTHILILDPFEQWSDLSGINWEKTRTKLITHPGCYPDLITNWPNEILLYLQNAGRSDNFYQDEQQKMYSWREGDFRQSTFHFYIKTAITIFACSPPMELFVGEVLGYEKFFLAGCDFAFHSDKNRFTNYTIDNNQFSNEIMWYKNEHPFNPDNPNLVKTNNGLFTESVHLYYLKNLVSAWRLCNKTLFTTDHGAMTQIPFHDIKSVIKRQGDYPKQSKYFIDSTCDTYLSSTGAYVIETNHGVSFVESPDFEKELPNFMAEVMSRYTCDFCKTKFTINPNIFRLNYNNKHEDFNSPELLLQRYLELKFKENIHSSLEVINVSKVNHNEEECIICHKGKIHKDVEIDINANINRIKNSIKKGQ